MSKRPTDEELRAYMTSPEYHRRAAQMQKAIREKMDRGEKWTFDEVAEGLDLPLDVVLSMFMDSMAKAGMPVRPVGRVQ